MIKVVNLGGLGVEGRQNELIEVALTYGFDAVEVDMADLLGRNKMMGRDFALQFLKSGGTKVGSFRLPIDFGADEATYQKQLADLTTICELANALECSACYAIVESSSDGLAFQENFDRHLKRLNETGDQLAKAGVKMGLRLQPKANRTQREYNFIQSASDLLTLVRMVGNANVGVCFDALAWIHSDGTLEDLLQLKVEQITEVRLADSDGENPILPGSTPDSFSLAVAKHLKTIGYDGLISVVGNTKILGAGHRDNIMPQLARRLDDLVEIVQGTRDDLTFASAEGEVDAESSVSDENETAAAGEALVKS